MPSKRLRVLLTFTRVAHDLAGHRKEVGAAMPFLLFVVHEPQIRFMDQIRRQAFSKTSSGIFHEE